MEPGTPGGAVHPRQPSAEHGGLGEISGIVAVSGRNAWLTTRFDNRPVIEQWDGTRWSVVPTPGDPVDAVSSRLAGLAAGSERHVWAVGTHWLAQEKRRCLVEHWDGRQWSAMACPAPPNADSTWLDAVTVAAPGDVWAVVGWVPRPSGDEKSPARFLIEHWDGTGWQVVAAPDQPATDNTALGMIAARSTSDIFAGPVTFDGIGRDLLHWDGARWRHASVGAPNPPLVTALAAGPDGRIWAVGNLVSPSDVSSDGPERDRGRGVAVFVNDT